MEKKNCLIAGLPESGKSTYLGALWYITQNGNGKIDLALGTTNMDLPENTSLLDSLSQKWKRGEDMDTRKDLLLLLRRFAAPSWREMQANKARPYGGRRLMAARMASPWGEAVAARRLMRGRCAVVYPSPAPAGRPVSSRVSPLMMVCQYMACSAGVRHA